MMSDCLNHLDWVNYICPECNCEVNEFGNTEYQFEYCSYPNCGCDGARNCMANNPSEFAIGGNIEGMWNISPNERQELKQKKIKARIYLLKS